MNGDRLHRVLRAFLPHGAADEISALPEDEIPRELEKYVGENIGLIERLREEREAAREAAVEREREKAQEN